MPVENNFQHSKYSRADPGDRVAYLDFEPGAPPGSDNWQKELGRAAMQLSQAGVRAVLYVSGLPYWDPFGAARLDEVGGLKRGYSRGISGLESLLALMRPETNGLPPQKELPHPPLQNDEQIKKELDGLVGEKGNFSHAYVKMFEKAVNASVTGTMGCERYVWSSLTHHLGRVEAALDLMEFLQKWAEQLAIEPGHRVLVQGHGHAGQVLALVSNFIVPGEVSNRQLIFRILANYYERVQKPHEALTRLDRLYRLLTTGSFMFGAILDVVTLGTPIRYGWDPAGLGKLLHIVNHRPIRGDAKRWLAKMELPQVAWEMPLVSGGDYVQQLAVAGTDVVPESEEMQFVNRELREVLEPYDGFERWLECARRGTRCANDGQCLLVDYKVDADVPSAEHLFGYGCYTSRNAMLFHTLQIMERLYSI